MGFMDKLKGNQPQAPRGPSAKVTGGRVNQVVCPYCAARNDFRGLHKGSNTSSLGGGGSNLVDAGAEFSCDSCHHIMQVVKVETVEVISVRQHPKRWQEIAPKEIRR